MKSKCINGEIETPAKKSKIDYEIPEHGKHQSENFCGFPNEVWLQIFEYLDTKDLILKIGPVCKRFHALSLEAVKELTVSLEENIEFTPKFSFSQKKMLHFIGKF